MVEQFVDGVLGGEGSGLGAFDGQVGGGSEGAEGVHEDVIGLQGVEGLVQGGRQTGDAPGGEGRGVDVDGVAGVEAAADAVQARVDDGAQRQVGVGRGVGGLELQIGGRRGVASGGEQIRTAASRLSMP